MTIYTIMLQAAGQPQANPYVFPLMMVGMVVVMYFFMIRPQAKKAKEQKTFAASIGVGEQIITTAGIHGKISKENEDGTVKLEVSMNNYITIERSAVSMEMTAAYRKKTNPTAVATK